MLTEIKLQMKREHKESIRTRSNPNTKNVIPRYQMPPIAPFVFEKKKNPSMLMKGIATIKSIFTRRKV